MTDGNYSHSCFALGSRFNRIECIPSNGGSQNRKSRTTRLLGETGSRSRSSDKHSESSDDQPPIYWKLRDSSSSTDKSDGGNKNYIKF